MNWTDGDFEAAERAAVAAVGEPIPDDIREMARKMFAAVMTCAVELVQTRGGTMEPGALEGDLLTIASRAERLPDTSQRLRQHITAQGATVATLQAKVTNLEGENGDVRAANAQHAQHVVALQAKVGPLTLKVNNLEQANADLHQQLAAMQRERDSARAEVERLKAVKDTTAALEAIARRERDRAEARAKASESAVERLKAEVELATCKANEKHDALLDAESRLAAIRERGANIDRQMKIWNDTNRDFPAVMRWVLEGDSPHEKKAVCERDAARAEVERLKAELVTQHNYRKLFRYRAVAAESRLAAIRERGTDDEGLMHGAGAVDRVSQSVARSAARWVLEGDAPNSPKIPDGSNDAPQEAKAVDATLDGDPRTFGDMPPPQEAPTVLNTCICQDGTTELCLAARHPCSSTCTHADAANPGHTEREKEESVAVVRAALGMPEDAIAALAKEAGAKNVRELSCFRIGHGQGVEDMRAACWEAVRRQLISDGWVEVDRAWHFIKAAIEGATP